MKTIKQAKEEYSDSLKLANVNGVDKEEFEEYAQIDFQAGVEFAQRWIPVEEELPPIDIDVILKYRYFDRPLYWVGTINTIDRLEHFLKKHLLFTHWRPIKYP